MKVSENFGRWEFACNCGCGFEAVDVELLGVLEQVRAKFRQPVTISSGCRCVLANIGAVGRPSSKHLRGIAADIRVKDTKPADVATYLEGVYPKKYGIGRYRGHTHIDVRREPARWEEK